MPKTIRLEPSPALQDNKLRAVTDQLIVSDEARAEIMDRVRRALYDVGGPDDVALLAQEVGKSVSCLYLIRSGRARWPRWDTLFALLPHLGLTLKVVKVRT